MADFELIPADRLIARLEEYLSNFAANGLLDIGQLYPELRWMAERLGLAVYEEDEELLKLENHTAELPCNFYLLDSAWLCDAHPTNEVMNFQSKVAFYTEIGCETVLNKGNCNLPTTGGMYPVSISACNMDKVLNKTTIKEYVLSNPDGVVKWYNPKLMTLVKGKSVEKLCVNDCPNLFYSSPDQISIKKKGNGFWLSSTLKDPVIYVKYYAYPIDKETGLPLVPDNQILEDAYFYRLIHYFLQKAYINGDDTNLEQRLAYAEREKDRSLKEALNLVKLPSFAGMVNYAKRVRRRFKSYEVMNIYHY